MERETKVGSGAASARYEFAAEEDKLSVTTIDMSIMSVIIPMKRCRDRIYCKEAINYNAGVTNEEMFSAEGREFYLNLNGAPVPDDMELIIASGGLHENALNSGEYDVTDDIFFVNLRALKGLLLGAGYFSCRTVRFPISDLSKGKISLKTIARLLAERCNSFEEEHNVYCLCRSEKKCGKIESVSMNPIKPSTPLRSIIDNFSRSGFWPKIEEWMISDEERYADILLNDGRKYRYVWNNYLANERVKNPFTGKLIKEKELFEVFPNCVVNEDGTSNILQF